MTVYPTSPVPWRQAIYSSEFQARAQDPRRDVSSVVRLVDEANKPVAFRGSRGGLLTDATITGGSVEMVGESQQQWQLSGLTMVGPEWVPTTPEHPLDPRSPYRLAVFWRLLVPELGGWVPIPCGVYRPSRPQIRDNGTVTVTVDGHDVLSVASKGGYGGRVLDVGGTTTDVALTRILAVAAPRVPFRAEPSSIVLPDVYQVGARKPMEDVEEISGMAGQIVRADREGVLQAFVPRTPDTPALTLREGVGCQMSELTREISDVVYNRVVVVGTHPDLTEPVVGTAEDDNETSPTWVGRFGPYELMIESDAVKTNAAADNLAAMHLGRFIRPSESLAVTMRAWPWLEYRDLVPVTRRRSGVQSDYRASKFTLGLPVPREAPPPMGLTMMSRQVAE